MKKGKKRRILFSLLALAMVFPLALVQNLVTNAEERDLIDVKNVSIVESSLEGKVDENGAVKANQTFDISLTAIASEDLTVYDILLKYRGDDTRYSKYVWENDWVLEAGEESTCKIEVEVDAYQPTDNYQLEEIVFTVDEYEDDIVCTRTDSFQADFSMVNENGDSSVPTITSVKRTPTNGIETDTEVTYQITYNEQGSGIEYVSASFDLVGVENEEVEDYYSEEFWEPETAVGSATVECTSTMRQPGDYELYSIYIVDYAGNEVEYKYNDKKDGYVCYINGERKDNYEFTIDIDDTYQVKESSKPIEDRAVILEELKLVSDRDKVIAPDTLKYEMTWKAPEEAEIYDIELEYYSATDGKTIYAWADLADDEGNGLKPGKTGQTIEFKTELDGYISEGNYELIGISFMRIDENGMNYGYVRKKNADGTYGLTFEGKSELNCDSYNFTYDKAADFTVISSLGVDDVAPEIKSISLTPESEIGINTPLTLKVEYNEEGSGISGALIIYETEDSSEIFSYNIMDDNNESQGGFEITTNRRKSGTYKLTYLEIMDEAGNSRIYTYSKKEGCFVDEDKAHRFDAGEAMSYVVAPMTSPVADEMIILQDVRIQNAETDHVKSPATLVLEVSATAPEKIAISSIEVYFYSQETESYITIFENLEKNPWKPGLEGDIYQLELELNGYETLGKYELDEIDFLIAGTEEYTMYYRTYDEDNPTNIFYGEDEATLLESEYIYDGAADFTVKENLGEDTVSPKILAVKQKTEGPYYPDSKIEYTVEFEEKESGIAGFMLIFAGEDEEDQDYYLYEATEKVEGNKITVSSEERTPGNYRLSEMLIADNVGNIAIYFYNEDDACWEVSYDLEKTERVTIKADETYTVVKACSHKWVKKAEPKASFEDDGILIKVCSKCGAALEGFEEKIPRADKVELSYDKATYNGKVKKPSVTVWDSEGDKLSTSDYSVSYESGRKYPGEYTVKVTLKNEYEGTKEVTFAIQPKAPTSVKATIAAADAVKVTWNKSTGADAYHVYYKASTDTDYQFYAEETGTSKMVSGLDAGVKYTFKVVPCYEGKDELVASSQSATASVTTLAKVAGVSVERYSSTKVRVRWNNIANETGYEVVRIDTEGNEKITGYKTTSGKSKTVTATADKEYQYIVRAYKTVNSKKIYGPDSDSVTFTLRNVKAVKDVKAVLHKEYNKVKVTWAEVPSATGYNVSMKKGTGAYKKLDYTENLEYIAEGLDAGAKYTFKVQPCYVEDGKEVATGTSETSVVYTLKQMAKPKAAKASSKVKITWTNISGESGYEVSQSTSEEEINVVKTWKTTSGTSTKLSADKGVTYYYRVRAFKTVGEEIIYGEWSDAREYTRK